MKKSPRDLGSEASQCPIHPDTNYSSVSLDDNAAKRVFCAKCYDSSNSILNPISDKKIKPLETTTRHQELYLDSKFGLSKDVNLAFEPTPDQNY